ncbi:hypothetical protein [Halomonas caseinilytica]|uniref:hypothetical protein n=1 Tax=Halomonas caseinilytica TaxID=438744 RepID=UPI0008C19DA0|nr:hypothetical protein [Halomonas caseinilytica]SEN44705.1 hypothetical protein SAMN04487952_11623 [Halomonas caseinilytica]
MIKHFFRLRSLRNDDDFFSKKNAVIHIGAPKAGSSALQRFCNNNNEKLKEFGFYYPEHSMDKNGVSGGHTQIAGRLVKNDIEKAKEKFDEWLSEADRKGLTLLLSAEAFYGKHAEMKEIAGHCNVRIIAYMRNPIDYLIGNHNQGIKRHMSTRRLSYEVDWSLDRSTGHLAGLPLLAWADAFGDKNCCFLPYFSPERGGGSIEASFLKAIGVEQKEISDLCSSSDSPITNRSYVASALELKRLFNTVLADLPSQISHEVDWALQAFSDSASHLRSYRAYDLPEEVRVRLLDRFQTQMSPVIERFPKLSQVWDEKYDFYPDKLENQLDLWEPLNYVSQVAPNILETIKQKAKELRGRGAGGYPFYRLLEVLNIDFHEPYFYNEVLSDQARNVIAQSSAKDADYLREFALALERMGCLRDAFYVIERASEKRPHGKGILRIKERIHKKVLQIEKD